MPKTEVRRKEEEGRARHNGGFLLQNSGGRREVLEKMGKPGKWVGRTFEGVSHPVGRFGKEGKKEEERFRHTTRIPSHNRGVRKLKPTVGRTGQAQPNRKGGRGLRKKDSQLEGGKKASRGGGKKLEKGRGEMASRPFRRLGTQKRYWGKSNESALSSETRPRRCHEKRKRLKTGKKPCRRKEKRKERKIEGWKTEGGQLVVRSWATRETKGGQGERPCSQKMSVHGPEKPQGEVQAK